MNIDDVLLYGHKWVLKHVEDLPAEQWDTEGVCGWWSVRHILSHLAASENLFVDGLNMFLETEEDTPTFTAMKSMRRTGGNFNEQQVSLRQDWSVEQVMQDYTEAQAKVQKLFKEISREQRSQAGTIPWYGNEYDLEDWVTYANYGHKREHCAQIAVYRDSLGLKT
jgi:uncharacterized damage-inducible protein DinB